MAAISYLRDLRQDVGLALRLLRRAPGFSLVAVATLAVGIGASTAAFTVLDAVLLRPLSFPDPHELTAVWTSAGSRVSPAYLHEWRASPAFRDMAGWFDEPASLTGAGAAVEVFADRVTPNFFAVLGTPALVGRTFTWEPALRQADPEVVLSYGLWQRRYGGDPAIVGQPIAVDGRRLTVVGVMPRGFAVRTLELAQSRAEMWLPRPLEPGDPIGMGGALNVVGRLRPGTTPAQASEQLLVVSRRMERDYPSYSREWSVRVLPLLDATVKDIRLTLLVTAGAVGLLLLIACVNVASLVLSRAATRDAELGVRLALGASNGRLARQFAAESAVLAALGGGVGVILAGWGTTALRAAMPPGVDLPRASEIGVDLRVLAVAGLVSALTALLFGLAPVLGAVRHTPHRLVGASTRTASAAGRRRDHGGLLVACEVALAVVLLTGAGLLGRSLWNLSIVTLGFEPAQVLTMRTTLPVARYDSDVRLRGFGRDVLAGIARLPGVRAAGTVSYLPMSRAGRGGPFEIAGRPEVRPSDRPGAWESVVGGRYFEAMGIPLLRGRLPGDADTAQTPVVIVIDELLAERYWPGANPIGARLVWPDGPLAPKSGEVIGVVGRVRWAGAAREPEGVTYHWFPQQPERQMAVVARRSGDPAALATAMSAAVTAVDPEQPVADVRTMTDIVSADLARPRFTLAVLGAFAAVALVLAAIGLFGVVSFNAGRRTREIGVRIALGATRRDVVRLVVERTLRYVGAGLAAGTLAALASGRLIAGVLHGVTPADPITLATAAVVLGCVGTLAAYLPARRATAVNPAEALRAE